MLQVKKAGKTRRTRGQRPALQRGQAAFLPGSINAAMGIALVVCAVVCLVSIPAAAVKNEPTGFEKARFGMSVEEVRKIFPQMKVLTTNLGAASIGGPLVHRFVLKKHQVSGLPKPTHVELRFWKDQLWVVIVYFRAEDLGRVTNTLTARHGPPQGKPKDAVWVGEKATIIVAGKAGWYSVHDIAISNDAQAVVMEELKRSMASRQAQIQRLLPTVAKARAVTPKVAAPSPVGTPEQ